MLFIKKSSFLESALFEDNLNCPARYCSPVTPGKNKFEPVYFHVFQKTVFYKLNSVLERSFIYKEEPGAVAQEPPYAG